MRRQLFSPFITLPPPCGTQCGLHPEECFPCCPGPIDRLQLGPGPLCSPAGLLRQPSVEELPLILFYYEKIVLITQRYGAFSSFHCDHVIKMCVNTHRTITHWRRPLALANVWGTKRCWVSSERTPPCEQAGDPGGHSCWWSSDWTPPAASQWRGGHKDRPHGEPTGPGG